MRRRLFALASAVSLLCIGAIVGGIQSSREPDQVVFVVRHSLIEMHLLEGCFIVGVAHFEGPDDVELTTDTPHFSHGRMGMVMALAFIAAEKDSVKGFGTGKNAVMYDCSRNPHWALAYVSLVWIAAFFSIAPMVWAVKRVRSWNRSSSSMRCRKCSYNLTGNTSGVCPECGAAVTAS